MDHDAMWTHVQKLMKFRDDFLVLSKLTIEEFHKMAEDARAKRVEDAEAEDAARDSASKQIVPLEPETKTELDANGLRMDGPTVAQYVAQNYKASTYPPSGYASKSTPEEIAAAVAAEKAAEPPIAGAGSAGGAPEPVLGTDTAPVGQNAPAGV